tara:strand:- start:1077 stop:2471 length:1395 start_codon:yes stop_codon:yes gene_type:complete
MAKGPQHTTQVGAFTPATARTILDVVKYIKQAGFVPTVGAKVQQNPQQETPLYIQNISDDEMPAYGCMQIVGTKELEGMNYLLADKPRDIAGAQGPYLWNKHVAVPAGEYGTATAGPHIVTQYDSELDTPAGTGLGPVLGEWFMATGSLVNVCGPTLLLPPGEGDVVRGIVQHGPSMQMIAFDTGGYCSVVPEPTCWYVTIIREGNDDAPSQSPADFRDHPADTTLVYEGWSYDLHTGGNGYNIHLWIYQTCDASFSPLQYSDSGSLDDWVAELPENAGSPNDSWLLTSDGNISTTCTIDDQLDLRDAQLSQASLAVYAIEDLFGPIESNNCPVVKCDARSESLNVIGREIRVKVTDRSCGVKKAHGEDASGYVTVRDTLGAFLYGRTESEIICRKGVAAWMQTDGEYDCHWLIVFMDMFDEIQVVHDVIVGTRSITIERKKVDIWRHCDLDDERIEGNTCEES